MKVTPTPAGSHQRTVNRVKTWIKNNERKIEDHQDEIEEALARIKGLFLDPNTDSNMILYAVLHEVSEDVESVKASTNEIKRLVELNKNLASMLEDGEATAAEERPGQ